MMTTPDSVYHHPDYYHLAYAYRNCAREVAVMETLWQRHGRSHLQTVLDLACGHAPHAPHLLARGYRYLGLDREPAMLTAAARRAPLAVLHQGDIRRFTLTERVDLAMVMLGSLYLDGPADLASHLDSVARCLRPGGLYLLDWCVLHDPIREHEDDWTVTRGGVSMVASYRSRPLADRPNHFRERLRLHIDAGGHRQTLEEITDQWAITAEAMAAALAELGKLEFVGEWNDWDPDRPYHRDQVTHRPIMLLRRI